MTNCFLERAWPRHKADGTVGEERHYGQMKDG